MVGRAGIHGKAKRRLTFRATDRTMYRPYQPKPHGRYNFPGRDPRAVVRSLAESLIFSESHLVTTRASLPVSPQLQDSTQASASPSSLLILHPLRRPTEQHLHLPLLLPLLPLPPLLPSTSVEVKFLG
ncbi:hypothetical protein MGYG_08947 [Nannizzia gypsea CBS 118893]|uniref:Uncharacterized protein n=1 Tax=Arthroderma gypseum (strain ATCC MYA-4604 / CBS 118893) TaxID=535722 RepID=E5R3F4_ARTGP|nr:hypothetical protein MGYG_08947 [Nannizzia gypsea CBS 118893]EFQ98753.1 hypothetical protein MGYG_08947 [Nannizzia gypsea CBS 118893]